MASTRGAAGAWADRAAQGLSYAVSPLSVPLVLFGLVLGHFGAPADEIGRVVGVAFLFFAAVPLAYLVWMVRRGRVASIEVRDRAHRPRVFVVGLGSYAAGGFGMYLAGATAAPVVAAVAACIVVNAAVLTLVTLRWKISLHAAAIGGFVSTLLFVALTAWPGPATPGAVVLRPEGIAPLVLLVPLLIWARIRVRAHTPAEAAAGGLFGIAVPYAELVLLQVSGWL